MVDELFDRNYQATRAKLNRSLGSAIGNAVRAVVQSFDVLHRIEWSAPWLSEQRTTRRA